MKALIRRHAYKLVFAALSFLAVAAFLKIPSSAKLATHIATTELTTEKTVAALTDLLSVTLQEQNVSPQTQAVATTSTTQPSTANPANKPAPAAPTITTPPTTPAIVNWPLTAMFSVITRCYEGVQMAYTDVIYTSTAANTAGVQLSYRQELVASGVSLAGYTTSQDFAAFVAPNSQHINAPAGFSFAYPVIPSGGSISLKLTTLQPNVAPSIRTLQNVCP